jgi:hypothetical protein
VFDVVIATAAAVFATATFIVVPAIAVVSVFAHFVFNAISMEISGHKLIIPVGKTRRWRKIRTIMRMKMMRINGRMSYSR